MHNINRKNIIFQKYEKSSSSEINYILYILI